MLNLIYIWNDNAANVSPKTGFSLNTKYDINFNDDMDKPSLTIWENPSYVSNFWGSNIVDAIAIVGENGSGKTMLLNYIIESLSYIEVNEPPYDYFILFRDEPAGKFICYVSDKYGDVDIEVFSSNKNNHEEMKEHSCNSLKAPIE